MQSAYFGLLVFLFLLACNPSKKLAKNYGSDMFTYWKHAHEEDKDGIKMYRPATYAFPPSRGREGFELHKDGSLIHYPIGADDRSQPLKGSWTLKGKNELIFKVNGKETNMQIVEKTDGRLGIRH